MTTKAAPILQCLSQGPPACRDGRVLSLPHVLFVLDGFPKALGGGERIVLRLAELLPQYGFRTSILTLAWHPESEFQPEQASCPVYLLRLTSTYNLKAWRGAWALGRFLRQQKVVLVSTFFESSDLWAGSVTRLFSRARLVWNRRDMGILRGRKHALAYRALRALPHAVCAVSDRVARHVMATDGVQASRVHVVYNGLALPPLAATAAAGQSSTANVQIKTLGNVRYVKGHDLLVEAAAEVLRHYPEALFSVAGEVLEPDYFNTLQERLLALGIQDRFRFVGKISNLSNYLQDATLFVLPSRSEGFSNALIEAMAFGLPVIATDVGGNAEAVSDGVNGVLISPDDAPALATALLDLLQNPPAQHRLGTAARDTVEEKFSTAAMMHQLLAVFSAVLERNTPTQP